MGTFIGILLSAWLFASFTRTYVNTVRRRQLSNRTIAAVILATALLGPVGLLSVFLFKKGNKYPTGYERDLKLVEFDISAAEKELQRNMRRVSRIESRLSINRRFPFDNTRLERARLRVTDCQETLDKCILKKASIYNPLLKDDIVGARKIIDAHDLKSDHDTGLSDREREMRIQKIRGMYINLCEKEALKSATGLKK